MAFVIGNDVMSKDVLLVFFLMVFGTLACNSQRGSVESIGNRIETQVIGTVKLHRVRSIEIAIGNGPVVGSVGGIGIGDSSFFLVDMITDGVYEFDTSGKYLRNVGRRGKGPGEYLIPGTISFDESGYIYIYDSGTGRLNVYDPSGRFVENLNRRNRIGYTERLELDSHRNLLHVTDDHGISKLRKFKRGDLSQIYSVSLSSENTNSVVMHLGSALGFCYSRKTDRIYYLLPTDYRVKEIAANDGRVLASFGIAPSNYRALQRKFYGRGELANPEQISEIVNSTTLVTGTYLLNDEYLLVGHHNPGDMIKLGDPNASWLLYDLTSKSRAYNIENSSILSPFKGFATKDSLLYVYSDPDEGEMNQSNGRFEVFSLVFDEHADL